MYPNFTKDFHIVLVVSDAERSADWYRRVFGFEVVWRTDETVLSGPSGQETSFSSISLFHFPTGIFIGVSEHKGVETAPFCLTNAGIQHFALHVEQRADLAAWSRHLDGLGISHTDEIEEGPGLLVRFFDPDSIPIEVYWPNEEKGRKMLREFARTRVRAARDRKRAGS